ncbi:hypothetical protein [Flavobacterium sp.]|uniref:hypothetical protein n=1 Tax=Flavobacterium sp. TaxID=239 RepID=UPI002625EF85|nr:hypothetical protein [Flavobacterium sp.]
MQNENLKLQRQLLIAQKVIEAQKESIEALKELNDTLQSSIEMYRESIAYHIPKLMPKEQGFKAGRIYLPVYGKIDSPPFSKN